MIRLFRKKFLMKCRIAEDRVSELGSLIRYLQISYIVQNVEVLMDLGDGIAQRKMIRSGNVFIPTGMEDTSPVNAGADEIRDTAVMVLFQGKEFSLSKPERENSFINMVCSHPQLGSPLCGSCRRLRGCRCV